MHCRKHSVECGLDHTYDTARSEQPWLEAHLGYRVRGMRLADGPARIPRYANCAPKQPSPDTSVCEGHARSGQPGYVSIRARHRGGDLGIAQYARSARGLGGSDTAVSFAASLGGSGEYRGIRDELRATLARIATYPRRPTSRARCLAKYPRRATTQAHAPCEVSATAYDPGSRAFRSIRDGLRPRPPHLAKYRGQASARRRPFAPKTGASVSKPAVTSNTSESHMLPASSAWP
jgi:hypothetical protein